MPHRRSRKDASSVRRGAGGFKG